MDAYPRNLGELDARFATEDACREYLAALRWPDGFRCPRCGGSKAWRTGGYLRCAACHYKASQIAVRWSSTSVDQKLRSTTYSGYASELDTPEILFSFHMLILANGISIYDRCMSLKYSEFFATSTSVVSSELSPVFKLRARRGKLLLDM